MAVTVTPSNGSNLTWTGSTFAWGDIALKTWATSYPVTYDVAVTEAVATVEALSENFAHGIAETLTVADLLSNNITKKLTEALATLDSVSLNYVYCLNFGENLAVSDFQTVAFSQSIQELINAIEVFSDAVQYHLNVAESLSVAEIASAGYSFTVNESFAVSDTSKVQFGKLIGETLALSESFSRIAAFYLAVSETVGASDSQYDENVILPLLLNEALSVQDSLAHVIFSNPQETLTLSELLSKNVGQSLDEVISFVDAENKTYTMKVSEALSVIEAYVRKANAVYSNMIVNTGDITQFAFDELVDSGKMVGYDKFREFIPGNYTYQKAMFRAILESTNADRARLNLMKVTADVPDIFDRGSVTIGAGQTAGVVVTFARPYHVIPEITVTLKSGTTISIPVVSSPSITEFTVMLKDPSTNTGTTGTLSWAAHGY